MIQSVRSKILIAIAASSAVALSACKPQLGSLIQRVDFTPSSNLEVVRIALVFGTQFQVDYSGSFPIKDYGFVFTMPYTPADTAQQKPESPFEVGFNLNVAVLNDQDLIAVTPSSFLPNGDPLPVGFPMVQVHGSKPISSQFDVFGYVDVAQASWLGAAAMVSVINSQYFPAGMSVNQAFLADSVTKKPGVIATVFGPTLDSQGNLAKSGGIAVFANVRQLLHHTVDIGMKDGETLRIPAETRKH